MQIKVNDVRLQYNENQQPEVILTTSGDIRKEVADLKNVLAEGKELTAEVKQYRKKRSLDANALLWVLCQKIAEKIHSTKELVYKTFIKRVGQFEIIPIKNEAVNRWIEVWQSKGLGWVAEILDDSKLAGYKKVISYYGSSCYNSKEMSVLIDEIVEECEEMGIETMQKEELESIKKEWGNKEVKK